MRRGSKGRIRDRQVEEFERRDLGPDLEKSSAGVIIRPRSRQTQTSILLDPAMIEKLKSKAAHRGIGYQTMLKIIVHEHVDEY